MAGAKTPCVVPADWTSAAATVALRLVLRSWRERKVHQVGNGGLTLAASGGVHSVLCGVVSQDASRAVKQAILTDSARASSSERRKRFDCLCLDLLVWLLRGTGVALEAWPKLLEPPLFRSPRPVFAKKALAWE